MKNQGRLAGLAYVLVSIPEIFALIYAPSRLLVHADAQTLFRIANDTAIASQIGLLWVALLLYDLLKQTNRSHAQWMVCLAAILVPIVLLNAMFFLYFPDRGFHISSIYSGLWLFPLGLLVYHSPQFPRLVGRILGVLLIANCCSYVINCLTTLATLRFNLTIAPWIAPLRFGEPIFMLALLILGTKPLQDPSHPRQPSF